MKNRLEKYFGEEIESFESIRNNENGANLWRVTFPNGEERFCVEGETGEIIENIEGLEAALEIWGE